MFINIVIISYIALYLVLCTYWWISRMQSLLADYRPSSENFHDFKRFL